MYLSLFKIFYNIVEHRLHVCCWAGGGIVPLSATISHLPLHNGPLLCHCWGGDTAPQAANPPPRPQPSPTTGDERSVGCNCVACRCVIVLLIQNFNWLVNQLGGCGVSQIPGGCTGTHTHSSPPGPGGTLGHTGPHWATLGHTEAHWATLGHTEAHWGTVGHSWPL